MINGRVKQCTIFKSFKSSSSSKLTCRVLCPCQDVFVIAVPPNMNSAVQHRSLSGKLSPASFRMTKLVSPSRPSNNRAWIEQQPLHKPVTSQEPQQLYEYALELARQEKYEQARTAFEAVLEQYPTMCKVWVSYAQMERRLGRTHDPLRLHVARQILQKGLQVNPDSGCLAQAWGLLELQKGNFWAAVRLLERSVDMDPFLEPVLRWKPVNVARMTVQAASSSRSSSRAAARMGCASAGGVTSISSTAPTAAAATGGKRQLLSDVSKASPATNSSASSSSCTSSI